MNGWLLLDKPTGITSREAVNLAQVWFPRRTKIGHTGTLDPLATGLLVLCVGSATRLADYVQGQGKRYLASFRLGVTSDTDDVEGLLHERAFASPPSESAVRAALHGFLGTISQVPPGYSAVKVQGKRAHKLARQGVPLELKPREVVVEQLELFRYEWPYLELEIVCGKGTYIRSLARDLGERLGCGGVVQTLRRTQVGAFRVENAIPLSATTEPAADRLMPLTVGLAHLPTVTLSPDQATKFTQGQHLLVLAEAAEDVMVVCNSRLFGLASVSEGRLHPKVVLVPPPPPIAGRRQDLLQ